MIPDDTVLCAESQDDAERIIGQVNNIGQIKTNEIKCEKKFRKLGRYSLMQEFF